MRSDQQFPNSHVAPHQVFHERAQLPSLDESWGDDFAAAGRPNRANRRNYVRLVQSRSVRMHLIGFGRWRRHIYLRRLEMQ